MARSPIEKTNFYFNLYEKGTVPEVYSAIFLKDGEQAVYSQWENIGRIKSSVIWVQYFPTYFIPRIIPLPGINVRKIFRVKGFCMSLAGTQRLEDYLKTHFKPNFRTALRRRLKALETCFDVRYQLYFGQIRREEYDLIMGALEEMLVRRFNQRNEEHMSLKNWRRYVRDTFDLILEKKASLFVIYDDQKPIQIALSYHYNGILFLSIPSYDIDYAKFGLGNIAIQKLLEWCIANDYQMLDMGFGAFDYKVKWCNETYDFEHHVFYRTASLFSRIAVSYISLKTQLINYLLAKNVNLAYRRFKSLFTANTDADEWYYQMEKVDGPELPPGNLPAVDPIHDDTYAFLRKAVYDFLYTRMEHISSIEVVEAEKNSCYYIISPSEIVVITEQEKK